MNTIFSLPMDIYKNRRLVAKLVKNDFKNQICRFLSGNRVGIHSAGDHDSCILVCLLSWFPLRHRRSGSSFCSVSGSRNRAVVLFQDALIGGTNSLLEYNYLVKKVVFNISVLPVVKIISAMFVHAFFVLFTIVLYAAYGKFPDLYYLQIIYYSGCVFMLVLGLSYATSAIVIFLGI